MLAKLLPGLVALTLATTGCVVVPAAGGVPKTASLDKVLVAVALPEGADPRSKGGTPWHRARLTLSRHDGGAPDMVQPLEAVEGGLKAKAPLRGLAPGDFYRMDLELIQDVPGGLERVVARGAMGADEDEGVLLKPGSNTLKIPVAPTVKGDRIALEPIVKRVRKDADTSFSWDDDDDDDALAEVVGAVGVAIIAGLLDGDDDEDDDED